MPRADMLAILEVRFDRRSLELCRYDLLRLLLRDLATNAAAAEAAWLTEAQRAALGNWEAAERYTLQTLDNSNSLIYTVSISSKHTEDTAMATFNWADKTDAALTYSQKRAIEAQRLAALGTMFPGGGLLSTRRAAVALLEDEARAAAQAGDEDWAADVEYQLSDARDELAQAERAKAKR